MQIGFDNSLENRNLEKIRIQALSVWMSTMHQWRQPYREGQEREEVEVERWEGQQEHNYGQGHTVEGWD